MDKYKASVTFYLESDPTTPYAKRQWDYIPRVGECVLLGAGGKYPADRNGLAMFMIKQICWGCESPQQESYGKQSVKIYVSFAK